MLAFDRDPLFGHLNEPLLRIEARRDSGRERWWIWRERDFFWFWIEGSPDFFGLFGDDNGPWPKLSNRRGGWFERAGTLPDGAELRRLLKHEIHHGAWVRAISLSDPRPEHPGVWRVLWRRRHFLLQHTGNNRAVHFHPETQWDAQSPHWNEMKRMGESAEFFAERFWPLLLERQGKLASAFEFLDLPISEQENPVRFGRGDAQSFQTVMRAALITSYEWPENVSRNFSFRFHHRDSLPLYDVTKQLSLQQMFQSYQPQSEPQDPRLKPLADTFQLSLIPGFARHTIVPSPFSLSGRHNEPRFHITAQGPFTHHELLEARLTVRDWLRKNAPELLPDWTK